MINKWNSLSQNNKITLAIVILTALFGVLDYFGKSWFESSSNESGSTVTQTTSSNYSPAINDTNGDVTININRSGLEKKP
jgi:hypothetical protein